LLYAGASQLRQRVALNQGLRPESNWARGTFPAQVAGHV
jgi:hypothetical protein